jgi:hypothetical protein
MPQGGLVQKNLARRKKDDGRPGWPTVADDFDAPDVLTSERTCGLLPGCPGNGEPAAS